MKASQSGRDSERALESQKAKTEEAARESVRRRRFWRPRRSPA